MPRTFEDNVNLYFDRAAAFTSYPRGLLDQIRACNGVYSFQFPVRHPDGHIEVLRGADLPSAPLIVPLIGRGST